MTDNLELFEFIKVYLGDDNWKNLKKITSEELSLFSSFTLDINKSYIVFGSEDLLNKFKAFYLTRCVKKRPLYSQYFILEYAEALSGATKDEFGLNIDRDLIFIYRHKHMQTLGNSETWLLETILNKVAERNRDGLVTIILSEQRMPFLEKCGELSSINLSGAIANKGMKEALDLHQNNTSTMLSLVNTSIYD